MAHRILVADDDTYLLRMVTSILQQRGYEVETAPDGEQAYEMARANIPDLLITDVMMPKMDGWALVRTLRSQPEFNFMPVIFLSALGGDEDRIRGFRLGADDYLPKPFRFEELELRIARTLRQRSVVEEHARTHLEAKEVPTRAPVALAGDLSEIGLPVLLTLLEMERKTGILHVCGDDKQDRAEIHLQDGRVVSADLHREHERVLDEECIYRILEWTSGRFEFVRDPVTEKPRISASATQLLMEGAKRIDELTEMQRRRPKRAPTSSG